MCNLETYCKATLPYFYVSWLLEQVVVVVVVLVVVVVVAVLK